MVDALLGELTVLAERAGVPVPADPHDEHQVLELLACHGRTRRIRRTASSRAGAPR
ncbi:hypothetical protein [Catellatospora sp. NPDC049133]|uniref:hypothetical protein n=1 Tax=Catellatospora sp. NPDC049133 TaxID=3155499 RepID=UPI0033E17723